MIYLAQGASLKFIYLLAIPREILVFRYIRLNAGFHMPAAPGIYTANVSLRPNSLVFQGLFCNMTLSFQGHTVVVTGAGGGLGKACVLVFFGRK